MSRPRWAALRLAARRSSGTAAARGVRCKRRGQGVAAGGGRWGVAPKGLLFFLSARAFDTYSEGKCRALAARFVADGSWQVPTLVRLRTQELADSPEYLADVALPYMVPDAVKNWREVTDKFHKLPPAMHATFREAYQRQLALTKLFDDAGVRMMAGTDGDGQVPGQSLHQEFDELAKAGLSPLKILQMTTLNPAEFLGRTTTMGSIEVGKNADLLLLDANPIVTVEHAPHRRRRARGLLLLAQGPGYPQGTSRSRTPISPLKAGSGSDRILT